MTNQEIRNLINQGKSVYKGCIKFQQVEEPKVFESDEEAIDYYLTNYKADVRKYYIEEEDNKLYTDLLFDYTYETFKLR